MYPGKSARRLNYEFNARLQKRLHDNKKAFQYLTNRGLTLETIKDFNLGLSFPYSRKKFGSEQADALMYPLRGRDGKFYNKYGYYNIPDVTLNPPESNFWISGDARTYYGDSVAGRNLIFVCQNALDLWRHRQSIKATGLRSEILLISSTSEADFPEEWKDENFWAGWEMVYLGLDNDAAGETLASQLFELIGREAKRVRVPLRFGKDWTDFWQGGADISEFTAIIRDSPIISLVVQSYADDAEGYGRFSYKPVNVNGAFHGGHLYYAVQILNRAVDVVSGDSGSNVTRDVERLETVVV